MRLFEMGSLPKKAGLAALEFGGVNVPSREDDLIRIPNEPEWIEWFPFKGRKQFLVRNEPGDSFWFGGTDERPFLVRVQGEAYKAFVEGGQAGFFDAIKPQRIKEAEAKWGPEGTRRQGDIFAYKLPWSWTELIENHWDDDHTIRLGRGETQLFGTRHVLDGKTIEISGSGGGALLIEGVVEAPDHKPMMLEGPHRVAQTALLHNPQLAD